MNFSLDKNNNKNKKSKVMRHKTYSMYGKAIDKNGFDHIVTVVGEFEQFKETVAVSQEVIIENKKGLLTTEDKVKMRSIKFGYAICHTDDEFDNEKGVDIAKKRAVNDPVGMLTTINPTMLTIDMCTMLVFGELNHIINNIDEYIH